jgi:tRNA dimethylallyltransferase
MLVGGTGLYVRTLTEGLLPAPGADKELRDRLLALESIEGEGSLHRRLQEIDPVMAARLHPRDRIRIIRAIEVFSLTDRRLSDLQEEHAFADQPYRVLTLGLAIERDDLYRAIDLRGEAMMTAGLLDEVRALLAQGYRPHLKAMRTIGDRECLQHLEGELSLDEAVAQIQQASRRYAKRQLTWFRKDKSIIWVDSLRESDKIQALIDNFIVQH